MWIETKDGLVNLANVARIAIDSDNRSRVVAYGPHGRFLGTLAKTADESQSIAALARIEKFIVESTTAPVLAAWTAPVIDNPVGLILDI